MDQLSGDGSDSGEQTLKRLRTRWGPPRNSWRPLPQRGEALQPRVKASKSARAATRGTTVLYLFLPRRAKVPCTLTSPTRQTHLLATSYSHIAFTI